MSAEAERWREALRIAGEQQDALAAALEAERRWSREAAAGLRRIADEAENHADAVYIARDLLERLAAGGEG